MDQRLITAMQILVAARLQMKSIEETRTQARDLVDPCVKLSERGFLGQLSHDKLVEMLSRRAHIESCTTLAKDRLKQCEDHLERASNVTSELSLLTDLNHQQGMAQADSALQDAVDELSLRANELERLEQIVLGDSKYIISLL